MTCVAAESQLEFAPIGRWDIVRAAVFWAFILLVIVAPAALSAIVLAQA